MTGRGRWLELVGGLGCPSCNLGGGSLGPVGVECRFPRGLGAKRESLTRHDFGGCGDGECFWRDKARFAWGDCVTL